MASGQSNSFSLPWFDDFNLIGHNAPTLNFSEAADPGSQKAPEFLPDTKFSSHNLLFDDEIAATATEEVKDEPPVFSDCMWSSAAKNQQHGRERKRDVSITLSECAEGLATITSLEMFDFHSKAQTGDAIFDSVRDASETDTDEEVDVVTASDSDFAASVMKQKNLFHKVQPGLCFSSSSYGEPIFCSRPGKLILLVANISPNKLKSALCGIRTAYRSQVVMALFVSEGPSETGKFSCYFVLYY